jgi:hypothetical protein
MCECFPLRDVEAVLTQSTTISNCRLVSDQLTARLQNVGARIRKSQTNITEVFLTHLMCMFLGCALPRCDGRLCYGSMCICPSITVCFNHRIKAFFGNSNFSVGKGYTPRGLFCTPAWQLQSPPVIAQQTKTRPVRGTRWRRYSRRR